jgi:GAF domain-containing protein
VHSAQSTNGNDFLVSEKEQLSIFLERANQIASSASGEKLLGQILSLVIEVCRARAGLLYVYDQDLKKWQLQRICNEKFTNVKLGYLRSSFEELVKKSLEGNKPIFIDGGDGRLHLMKEADILGCPSLTNTLYLPLKIGNEPVGLIQVLDNNHPEIELAQILANRMATEIDRMQLITARDVRTARFEGLVNIIGNIGATLDRDQILRMIVDYANELLSCDAASIFLLDEEKNDLLLYLSSNMEELEGPPVRVPMDRGIIGHVASTGETVIVNDAGSDERHFHEADEQSGYQTKSLLAVPLTSQAVVFGNVRGTKERRIIGGLEALNKLEGDFTEEDAKLLGMLAAQAGTVLEVAKLYADLNDLFIGAIRALTSAIDAKDPYTEGHSQRVSEFSVAIGRELGLPEETIYHLRIGALLHDVGKIGIPDAILSKPSRLNDLENEQIRGHPLIGINIMRTVRMLDIELTAMAEHHERLDGRGYPKGLVEEEISLVGKIVAVADVFDALTSNRPYRKAMTIEDVILHLRAVSGTHLDSDCVEALIRAHEKGLVRTEPELDTRLDVFGTKAGGLSLDDAAELDRN